MEEITRFLCIEPNIEPNMQHKQIICEQQTICFLMCSLDVFLHTQQIVCQQGLFAVDADDGEQGCREHGQAGDDDLRCQCHGQVEHGQADEQ